MRFLFGSCAFQPTKLFATNLFPHPFSRCLLLNTYLPCWYAPGKRSSLVNISAVPGIVYRSRIPWPASRRPRFLFRYRGRCWSVWERALRQPRTPCGMWCIWKRPSLHDPDTRSLGLIAVLKCLKLTPFDADSEYYGAVAPRSTQLARRSCVVVSLCWGRQTKTKGNKGKMLDGPGEGLQPNPEFIR